MSVCLYGCITMDGYLADKNHNLDWLYQTGSIEETGYESFYKSMDITIMGKRTYNEIENIESKIFDLAFDFQMDYDVDISVIIKNEEHFYHWLGALPFYDNVQKEGIVLNG